MAEELSQVELYEKVQVLYKGAKQLHESAMDMMREPVSYDYRKSVGPRADEQWLDTLQKAAGELYDRVAPLTSALRRVMAVNQALEAVAPKFIGLRAKRVEDMAGEVKRWATEIKTLLDDTVRLADEWQTKADVWERQLATENPEEREFRWMKEEYDLEIAEAADSEVYDYIDWD